jgi:hypothetical protein
MHEEFYPEAAGVRFRARILMMTKQTTETITIDWRKEEEGQQPHSRSK